MSMTLCWRPYVSPQGEALSTTFKCIMEDATRVATETAPYIMGNGDLGFLRGMETAGVEEVREDAKTLIEAIKQHGAVALWFC